MPFRLIKKGIYRSKIENFILDWFHEKIGLSESKINDLRSDMLKRARFFRSSDGFFERVIDIIMKNPELASKACNFVFDKDKTRNEEEALKVGKKRDIMKKKQVIQRKKLSSNMFLPHTMSKIQFFNGKSRNSSPFVIKKRSSSQGQMSRTSGSTGFNFTNSGLGNRSSSRGYLNSKM